MKKITRRILSLVCTLVLILGAVIPASAYTVSWSDSDGLHTANINVTNTEEKGAKYPSATTVSHTKGVVSSLSYTGGDTATIKWVTNATVKSYYSYIEKGMIELGLNDVETSKSLETASVVYKKVSASDPSGTYTVGSTFEYASGTWKVTHGVGTVVRATDSITVETGTFQGPVAGGDSEPDVVYKVS